MSRSWFIGLVIVAFAVIAWMAHVGGQSEMRALKAEAEAARIDGLLQQIEGMQSRDAYHARLLKDSEEERQKLALALDMTLRREKVWQAEMNRWRASSEWQQDRYAKLRRSFNWVTGWFEKAPPPRMSDSP